MGCRRVARLLQWAGLVSAIAGAPLRVAYLHQGLPVGGIESSLVNICRNVDRERVEPILVLFGRDPIETLLEDVLQAGCDVVRFAARWRNPDWSISLDEREVARLTSYLRESDVDVAFMFYGGAEIGEPTPLGVLAARDAGVPVVMRIEWVASAPPNLGIAAVEVSTPFVGRIQVQRGVRYPLHFVGGAVEAPSVIAKREDRSARTLVVGRLSRLILEKDPISFVLAAGVVRDALTLGEDAPYDEVRFVLGGDGPLAETLVSMAREHGLEDVVEFVGTVERGDLWEFLGTLDMFLYTSTCDSLGYVVLEAMAAGLPVVATRVCSMEDLIDDGVTGVLVDPVRNETTREVMVGSEAAERHGAAAVGLALRGREAMVAMGSAARGVVSASWSVEVFYDRHAGLLESVAVGRRASSSGAAPSRPFDATKRGSRRRVPDGFA